MDRDPRYSTALITQWGIAFTGVLDNGIPMPGEMYFEPRAAEARADALQSRHLALVRAVSDERAYTLTNPADRVTPRPPPLPLHPTGALPADAVQEPGRRGWNVARMVVWVLAAAVALINDLTNRAAPGRMTAGQALLQSSGAGARTGLFLAILIDIVVNIAIYALIFEALYGIARWVRRVRST